MRIATWMIVGGSLTACTETLPPWRLDHDRILAVRASPPHVEASGRATIDALIGTTSDGPAVVIPDAVVSAAEPLLEDLLRVTSDNGEWFVDAADEDAVAGARAALDLPPDMPVPVRVAVTIDLDGESLTALKTIYVGDSGANPELPTVTIGGQAAIDGLVLPIREEIALQVDSIDPETDEVDWLTSIGTPTDIDDPIATLTIEEAAEGWLALVVRNSVGGVAWGFWAVSGRP